MKEIRIGPFAHEHIQFDLTDTIASSKMNTLLEGAYIKFTSALKPSELVEIHIPAVIRDSVRLGEVSVLRGGYHPFKHCARTHMSLDVRNEHIPILCILIKVILDCTALLHPRSHSQLSRYLLVAASLFRLDWERRRISTRKG